MAANRRVTMILISTCRGVPPWAPLFADKLRMAKRGAHGVKPLQVYHVAHD